MEIKEKDFENIIRQNENRLRHLCYVYTDRKEDEKDLLQEIIIQIWRSLPSFKGDAKIDTWIYRLAINTAISFTRKKTTRKDYYKKYKKEKEGAPNRLNTRGQKVENNGKLRRLYNAISELNASEKAIITMYLEEFSYSEISFVTNITENYVGVKINRIKKKLTKIIGVNDGT